MTPIERQRMLGSLRRVLLNARRQLDDSPPLRAEGNVAIVVGQDSGAERVRLLGDLDGHRSQTAEATLRPARRAAMADPPNRVWSDIHDLLPAASLAGPTVYDPSACGWVVTASATDTGIRGEAPVTIAGTGEDELAALTSLLVRLREYGGQSRRLAAPLWPRPAQVRGEEVYIKEGSAAA